MEGNKHLLTSNCNFIGVKPIMMDLPYPPIQVRGQNRDYADLLSVDYCGSVSEMSAITQYIINENRMFCERCPMAKTILGIAMSEMIHLQKLGELIFLLGGNIDFVYRCRNGKERMWTPQYLNIPEGIGNMLLADIDAEEDAINQYKMHMRMINDDCVNAVLSRIIKDEEYHIMLLQALVKEV